MIKLSTASSLEKIFKDSGPSACEQEGIMLLNEVYNFQAAFFNECGLKNVFLEIRHKCFDFSIRYVRGLKADNEYGENRSPHDGYVLSSSDKIYPEILAEKIPDTFDSGWHSFWIQATAKKGASAGLHCIPVKLYSDGTVLAQSTYTIELLDGRLPGLDIPVTCWIHYDCIAAKHKVKLFEPAFYRVFEKYLNMYVSRGHNMLLVPAFTPPLDTAVGGERLTAQLVGVERKEGKYIFDFNKLDAFIDFAQSKGIKYFEFAHLFTQWGALACPKIIAETENGTEKIFGWETDSSGEEYKNFLTQYLPVLTDYITQKGIADRSFFHLSDEPSEKNLERYGQLYRFVKPLIGSIKTMDAISRFEFYERGIVDIPVVASDHGLPFLEHNAKHFVYYCCCQNHGFVSNRFFAMPSERNAVIGVQLYQNGTSGFLHWGFNFYNTQYSIRETDPYTDTASGGSFPSGDAFIVYPDGDGISASLRLEVFHEGIQLYLALKKLESLTGRENVVKMLSLRGFENYDTYPRLPGALKELKKEIYLTIQGQ